MYQIAQSITYKGYLHDSYTPFTETLPSNFIHMRNETSYNDLKQVKTWKIVNGFSQKSSIVDVPLGSQYASGKDDQNSARDPASYS